MEAGCDRNEGSLDEKVKPPDFDPLVPSFGGSQAAR